MSVSRNDSLNLRFLAVSSEPSPPRFRVPPLRISRPDSPPSDPVPQALKDTVSAALSEVAAAEGVTLFDVLRAACAVYADVSREDADHNSVRTNFSRVPVTPLVTDRSIVGPAVPPGGSRSAPSQPEGGWLHLNTQHQETGQWEGQGTTLDAVVEQPLSAHFRERSERDVDDGRDTPTTLRSTGGADAPHFKMFGSCTSQATEDEDEEGVEGSRHHRHDHHHDLDSTDGAGDKTKNTKLGRLQKSFADQSEIAAQSASMRQSAAVGSLVFSREALSPDERTARSPPAPPSKAEPDSTKPTSRGGSKKKSPSLRPHRPGPAKPRTLTITASPPRRWALDKPSSSTTPKPRPLRPSGGGSPSSFASGSPLGVKEAFPPPAPISSSSLARHAVLSQVFQPSGSLSPVMVGRRKSAFGSSMTVSSVSSETTDA